ncbi:SGNH/GDSL hydrolase family protein [Nocardioides jiangxiensis]|uniref:SGNH/GDSL hydrolase family protein n=1 Tax=Nocardioides jiangxiensis TaxID=3064524 RepID=A0ABT9B1G3_9ACTN|nr:SGNH/GDSL hydrolase family protein [Nocardioides sp. WY-20]MDO7868215.1 SGNH/GDSL hydrolase family protein [Nocardioides sp. WY-20]
MSRDLIRFAALGDSASCGVGDPTPDGWRGWAQLLAEAIGQEHPVSFCKLAVAGATVADVRRAQLADAVAHQPRVASLVVGLNDAMRASWDPAGIREDLLECAAALEAQGALLVTVQFHDHTKVLGLPGLLARPMRARIGELNAIYAEVHERHGVLQLDLRADPLIQAREMWAFDRLHPSELGHRMLARRVGELLNAEGLRFPLPLAACTTAPSTRRERARTLVVDVAPWLGRRVRDLAPWAARETARRTRVALHAA